MNTDFSIFRRYPTLAQAQDLREFLVGHGIEVEIGDNVPPLDPAFSGNTVMEEVEVRIRTEDFARAIELLEQRIESQLSDVPSDYYLFEFSNEELLEVLMKPDEWSQYDQVLAKHVLRERGQAIDDTLIASLRKNRIKELSTPETSHPVWIAVGYFFAMLGGLLGILIGYLLWTTRKTLPNGERIFAYSESDRKHGKYIFFLGLVILPISLGIRIMMMEP